MSPDNRRRARRRALALIAALVACGPGAALGAANAVAAAPAAARDPAPPSKRTSTLARIVFRTAAHAQPSAHSKRLGRVDSRSPWGGQNQLLVLRSARAADGRLWLDVRLPGRPNASHGWIPADHTALSTTPWRLQLQRASRRLTVWRAGQAVRRGLVVVGAPGTPTPAGLFAIADSVRQPGPARFVGRWVLPLTAHSEAIRRFDGGDGQTALHGRGGASLADPLGSARSHGCVRVDNALVDWIARHVPVGTPVRIS